MDAPDENIKPNDVALILRPIITDNEPWDGHFEILIAGIGPATIAEDSIRELISMAMMIATTIPLMEKDVEFTEKVMTECAKLYGDADDVEIRNMIESEDNNILTLNSKTVGGIQ